MVDVLVERGCIGLTKAIKSQSRVVAHLTERVTDCFEDNHPILLGKMLLNSGTLVRVKWMPAHQSARRSTLELRSGMHRGRRRHLVGARDLVALQSYRARPSWALVAFATCPRSSLYTYEVALDTIDRWAVRRQACVSAHLDHRSQAPSWRHEGEKKSQILAAEDRDHVGDVEDAGTGKYQERRRDLGGGLDGGKQRSRRKD